jgi:hypothetical protein
MNLPDIRFEGHGSIVLASDYDALAARLAEAEREIRYLRTYGNKDCTAMAEAAMARRELETPDSASAVQPERCCLDYPRCDCNSPPEPDNALACGHPSSLLLRSAETGEALYCELCDDKSGRRDAEQCETELRAEVERLKTALKTVGDDYPRSSCQQWCYEAAGIRAPTLQPCGHPWKAQHDFKCILCSSPKVTP